MFQLLPDGSVASKGFSCFQRFQLLPEVSVTSRGFSCFQRFQFLPEVSVTSRGFSCFREVAVSFKWVKLLLGVLSLYEMFPLLPWHGLGLRKKPVFCLNICEKSIAPAPNAPLFSSDTDHLYRLLPVVSFIFIHIQPMHLSALSQVPLIFIRSYSLK